MKIELLIIKDFVEKSKILQCLLILIFIASKNEINNIIAIYLLFRDEAKGTGEIELEIGNLFISDSLL